jgi:hypothetical protein
MRACLISQGQWESEGGSCLLTFPPNFLGNNLTGSAWSTILLDAEFVGSSFQGGWSTSAY